MTWGRNTNHLRTRAHIRCLYFLARYPGADGGPAHIVVGDQDMDDSDIIYAQAMVRAALSGNAADLPDPERDADWFFKNYENYDRKELLATARFLDRLQRIPAWRRRWPWMNGG